MKVKKFLEKVAEEDRESLINDKDIEFLASIGVDYNKKREAAKKEPDSAYYREAKSVNYRVLFASIACFLIVAITVVSLSLYFSLRSSPVNPPPINPSPVEPPIQYFDDNFVEVDSNLQELNDNLELFSLTVDESVYNVVIKKTYDSVSEDDLFFTLEFTTKQQGLGKKFKIDIVVNKLYEHEDLAYTLELKETQLLDYTLKYYEHSLPMSGMPFVNVDCMAEMQIGEQWIYVTKYEERALRKSTFIETLQSLIEIK